MKKVLMIVALMSVVAMPAWAWKDAWQDENEPRNGTINTPDGGTVSYRQKDARQAIVYGNDGTPYQVVAGGVINMNTGQFIPR